jgi:hypothetical protein
VLSVFWATILAIAVSYFKRDTALTPPKLTRALAEAPLGARTFHRDFRQQARDVADGEFGWI